MTIKVGSRVTVDNNNGVVYAIRIDSIGQPLIDIFLENGDFWVVRWEEIKK